MPVYTIRSVLAAGVALSAALMMAREVYAADSHAKEPVIIVSGEADASVAPDLAILTLGVSRIEKTAREALDGNNAAMSAVLKALKEQGIADKDLQTSSFAIQPQYSYPENTDGSQKAPVLTGYDVSNTLTVRVRDIAKVGAIIDQTVSLGVNQGGDIRFTNADPEKAIETARMAAVRNAAAKAKTLAEAAGVKLGEVVEISETSSRPEAMPMMRMSMAKQSADAVPVATGQSTYTVSVNVTFSIGR